MKSLPANRITAGALLWLALGLSPVRHILEATMTSQMLVQLPLLVLAGWLVGAAIPRRLETALARWNAGGVPGLLLATFVAMAWMVPRMMDASVIHAGSALAKFASVPLLVGVPMALSWPRMGFVTRGVLLLEMIATSFRLGWLFLVAPERLCSSYLLSDQLRLGRYLLAIGVAACLVLAWKLLWGRIRVDAVVTD